MAQPESVDRNALAQVEFYTDLTNLFTEHPSQVALRIPNWEIPAEFVIAGKIGSTAVTVSQVVIERNADENYDYFSYAVSVRRQDGSCDLWKVTDDSAISVFNGLPELTSERIEEFRQEIGPGKVTWDLVESTYEAVFSLHGYANGLIKEYGSGSVTK